MVEATRCPPALLFAGALFAARFFFFFGFLGAFFFGVRFLIARFFFFAPMGTWAVSWRDERFRGSRLFVEARTRAAAFFGPCDRARFRGRSPHTRGFHQALSTPGHHAGAGGS